VATTRQLGRLALLPCDSLEERSTFRASQLVPGVELFALRAQTETRVLEQDALVLKFPFETLAE